MEFYAARRGIAWHGPAGRAQPRHGTEILLIAHVVKRNGTATNGGPDMKINLDDVVLDETLYPRKSVSEYNVVRLANAIEAGASMPPIVLEIKTHRLVDGWHRIEAFRRLGRKTIDAIEKQYPTEGELFADSIRLNVSHGEHLDQYCIRNAVIRLQEFGFQRAQISEIVRLPPIKIEKIERGFAVSEEGKPIALKSGLSHMRGEVLSQDQLQINRCYSGPKAVFHAKLLLGMIEADAWPRTDAFISKMDELCAAWRRATSKAA
jgi:ParB-like nuclease domain